MVSIRTNLTYLHGFSAACAGAIVHRNHFFHLYQQNKSSESKVRFRQASNHCKRVLEAAKLAYATKTKDFITPPETWLAELFGELLIVFSTKVNLAIPPLFKGPEVLSFCI